MTTRHGACVVAVWLLATLAAVRGQQPWIAPAFPVGYWCGPPAAANTLEHWRRVADAHFTLGGMSVGYSVADNRSMLDLCQQVGLKALVLDSRINVRRVLRPGWQDTVRQVVADYATHPALAGYFIHDEPGYQLFKPLGDLSQELQRLDPSHLPYINLLPTYASTAQMGTPSYEDYLARFLAIARPAVLSYDHYCLQAKDVDGAEYVENLALVRDYAQRAGIPPWIILQAMTYDRAMRRPTAAEMRWQVYTSLAYGMKGILYYVYWSYNDVAEDVGIVDSHGQPGPLYPVVQQLNAEIKALGPTLLGLTSTGVYHTGSVPPGAARLGTTQLLSLPADKPLLVGFFRDADAVPHALIANRSHREAVEFGVTFSPLVTRVSEISTSAGGAARVLPHVAGQPLAMSLAPGHGRLLRLGLEFTFLEPPAPLSAIRFEFDTPGDTQGWGGLASLDGATVADGVLDLRFTGPDPFLVRDGLDIEPDTYAAIRIRLKLPHCDANAQFFWITDTEPTYADRRYLSVTVQPDGEWHEVVVPVATHPLWKGKRICGIRIDPTSGGARPGDHLQLDWVRGE